MDLGIDELLRVGRYSQALPKNTSLFGMVPSEKKTLCHTPIDSLTSVLDALDTLQIKVVLLLLRKGFHL